MAKLLAEEDQQPRLPKVGDLVEGKVLSVSKSEVHLDIDGITTGVVRGRELFDESGDSADLKISDLAQATILELENENGEMELSFRHAGHQKAWNELEDLQSNAKPIDVPIIEANRGGLMVRVGRVEGFLPVSQLTTEHYPRVEGGDKNKILEKLQSYVGSSFKVKVIDVDETDSKLIVSEKAAWEEQHQEKLSQYEVGQSVKGKVTGVVDFGAFVEFDSGLEGLVHISEMAWQRVDDPHDLVKVGDEIEVKIIGIEGNKISLSMKQLTEDPWMQAVEKYKVGDVVKGKVTKLNPFGAFVELDEEIHGLAHISELSEKNISHPGEVLKVDESYDFKILSIEPKSHRLGLSIKAINQPDEPAAEETKDEEEKSVPSDESSEENTEEEVDNDSSKEQS
ncbi:MAG: S1 RNA-binding domain-containing protein [Candidatus Nomurabacteria bacterium]|nr:MAG: S1 RNA-binding domain-containing protein [Candidatus Nomurabacteria bacterium]